MNKRVPSNKRYQPTEYEHAANCATHAVSVHLNMHYRLSAPLRKKISMIIQEINVPQLFLEMHVHDFTVHPADVPAFLSDLTYGVTSFSCG